MEEQTLVINDLLSFLTCKSTILARNDLFTAIRSYYTQDDIIEARNTLLASLPVTKSTRQARRVKRKDPLVELYECVHLVPESDLPMFVCRDLNNIPCLESDMIIQDSSSSDDDEDFDFKAEQNDMKTQIKRIASLASDLKRQLNNFMESSYDIPHSNVGVISSKRAPVSDDSSNHSEPSHLSSNAGEENPDENADLMSQDEVDYPDSLSELEGWEDKAGADDNTIREERVDIQPASHDADYTEKKLPDHLQDPQPEGIVCIKNDSLGVLDSQEMSQSDEKSIELSYEGQIVTSRDTLNPMDASELDEFDAHSRVDTLQVAQELGENGLANYRSLREPNSTPASIHRRKYENCAFSCKKCAFKTLNLLEYNSHLLSHYTTFTPDVYECSLCMLKESTLDGLREHMDIHDWRKPFVCHLCPYKSKEDTRMRSHYLKHYETKGPNQYECLICGKLCGTRNSLEKHKQMHKRSFSFECEHCHLTFPHKSALSQHVASHTREKSFACPYCGHTCDSQHALDTHTKVHFKSDDFACHICHQKFASKGSLRGHVVSQHPRVKPFKCEFCGEEFTFNHTYLVHRKSHLRGQQFTCRYCNKKFKSQSYLKIHYAIHEGKKPFKCGFCDYESTAKALIKKHESIHQNQMFSCLKCSYITKYPKELERHKLSHNSESFVDKLVVFMDE